MRLAHEILLTAEARDELIALTRSKLTSVRLAQRARIVLLAADGLQNKDIAAQVGVGRNLVTRWRERYVQLGLAGIERDLPRGAPPLGPAWLKGFPVLRQRCGIDGEQHEEVILLQRIHNWPLRQFEPDSNSSAEARVHCISPLLDTIRLVGNAVELT